MKHRIMIVDDEKNIRSSLKLLLEDKYHIIEAESGKEALDLLDKVREIDPDCIFIMITAFASVPSAIKALKNGAYDYITKPIDPDELAHIVEKAIHQKELKDENIQLKGKIDEIIKPDNLIGESRQMKKIFELINTVSQTDTTVMIRGESGTGKELVAKAIHINSKRKYFPIITVNCGALAETLLESELFGHEKGAFTGAHYKRKGKFEMADGGTIFLDEIGSITQKMQVELLRVIETKHFSRVGGNETIKSDFRVIAATNEPLENLLKEGKFREDLYYRLNVFSIFIPPLRERRNDIPILAYYFLNKFNESMNKNIKSISSEAMEFLVNYDWPGNVRELENAIERSLVVGRADSVRIVDLPFNISPNRIDDGDITLAAMEKKHILNVLEDNNWNISRSAEKLRIDRVTLYNKINKYGLRKSS